MTESDSIDSLQSASLDMDVEVNDTIMISGSLHAARLIPRDLIFVPLFLHNSFCFSNAYYSQRNSQIMRGSLTGS